MEDDASTEYSLTWAYTQGAIEAEGFYLIANFGDASPGLPTLVSHEWGVHLGPDARAFKKYGPKATKFASFGIAAWRRTDAGIAYTVLQTHANWTDLQAAARGEIDPTIKIATIEPDATPYGGAITKTIVIPFAELIPSTDSEDWAIGASAYIRPGSAATNRNFQSAVALTPGAIITGFSIRGYRVDANDIVQGILNKINASGTCTMISSMTQAALGWVTTSSGVLSETVGAQPYAIAITLRGDAAAANGRFAYATLTYTVADFGKSI